ncbi:MAG TPA: bZIP transcription factor [Bacteroidales bacterium]
MAKSKSKFEIEMGNIRNVISSYEEQGKDVHYSATFIKGREKAKLVDHAPVKLLRLVGKNLRYEKTDKIRIDLYDGKEAGQEMWFTFIELKEPEKEPAGFQGLGEAEINRMVDERFRERKQQEDYEEFKKRVQELTEENQELQNTIDQLEDKTSTLEQELESKKQIKYYAGMLGDILESFGIAKDRIKKPIAELMGITDRGDNAQKQIEGKKADNSGIVDEKSSITLSPPASTEEQKRNEIISLISEYLKTTSNQTLASVFSIFSEIEQDSSIGDKVIQFLTTLKNKENANV